MTNQEVVVEVLKRCGCQSSKQIATAAKRWYDYDITPSSVSGVLRSLAIKNKVASSNCGNGAQVYWLVNQN